MIYSLFVFPYTAAFGDDVDDPTLARYVVQIPAAGSKLNILTKSSGEAYLPTVGATYVLPFTKVATTDWRYILLQVVGQITASFTGLDTDGATAVASTLPYTGTSYYPDIGIISTYNVSSAITLTAISAGSYVRYFAGVSCDDTDSRLTTYA